MSKVKQMDSFCPCGTPISISIKKPRVQSTIMKFKCWRCKSLFLARCLKKEGQYRIEFELQELSPFAEEIVKWRMNNSGRDFKHPKGFKGFLAWIFGRFRV